MIFNDMAKKEWCSYSPESGTGPQDISFTPDENTGREPRTLMFTCSLGTKTATCTVNQAGAPLSVRITGQPPVSAKEGDEVSFKAATNGARVQVKYIKGQPGEAFPLYPATVTFPDDSTPTGTRSIPTDTGGYVTFPENSGTEAEFEITVEFEITSAMSDVRTTITPTLTVTDGGSGSANAAADRITVTPAKASLSWREGEMEFEPDGAAQTNRILTDDEENEWSIS